MLHVSSDDPLHPGRRINKMKNILEILIPNFQKTFSPGRCLSADETMVGFTGRFAPKQYMPSKPPR